MKEAQFPFNLGLLLVRVLSGRRDSQVSSEHGNVMEECRRKEFPSDLSLRYCLGVEIPSPIVSEQRDR